MQAEGIPFKKWQQNRLKEEFRRPYMPIVAGTMKSQSLPSAPLSESSVTFRQSQFSQYRVIRRNGAVTNFEPSEISAAVTKVFLAVDGEQRSAFGEIQPPVIDHGISLDPDILYQDLLAGRPGKGFSSSGLAPAAE